MIKQKNARKKALNIYFVSLGCDKNLVDSEMMITGLRKAGHCIIDNEQEADIIVVNTCCFIGDAKEESINTLINMGKFKTYGKCKLLVACGCLAQRPRRACPPCRGRACGAPCPAHRGYRRAAPAPAAARP